MKTSTLQSARHFNFQKKTMNYHNVKTGIISPVQTSKIMKFIGEIDMDCEDIFEGDIVTFTDSIVHTHCVVVYDIDSSTYVMKDPLTDRIYKFTSLYNLYVVIGNMYEGMYNA